MFKINYILAIHYDVKTCSDHAFSRRGRDRQRFKKRKREPDIFSYHHKYAFSVH